MAGPRPAMQEDWVTKNAREHVASEEKRHEVEQSNNSAWRLRKVRRWLDGTARLKKVG